MEDADWLSKQPSHFNILKFYKWHNSKYTMSSESKLETVYCQSRRHSMASPTERQPAMRSDLLGCEKLIMPFV